MPEKLFGVEKGSAGVKWDKSQNEHGAGKAFGCRKKFCGCPNGHEAPLDANANVIFKTD